MWFFGTLCCSGKLPTVFTVGCVLVAKRHTSLRRTSWGAKRCAVWTPSRAAPSRMTSLDSPLTTNCVAELLVAKLRFRGRPMCYEPFAALGFLLFSADGRWQGLLFLRLAHARWYIIEMGHFVQTCIVRSVQSATSAVRIIITSVTGGYWWDTQPCTPLSVC